MKIEFGVFAKPVPVKAQGRDGSVAILLGRKSAGIQTASKKDSSKTENLQIMHKKPTRIYRNSNVSGLHWGTQAQAGRTDLLVVLVGLPDDTWLMFDWFLVIIYIVFDQVFPITFLDLDSFSSDAWLHSLVGDAASQHTVKI